jgi:hypothetical protein
MRRLARAFYIQMRGVINTPDPGKMTGTILAS